MAPPVQPFGQLSVSRRKARLLQLQNEASVLLREQYTARADAKGVITLTPAIIAQAGDEDKEKADAAACQQAIWRMRSMNLSLRNMEYLGPDLMHGVSRDTFRQTLQELQKPAAQDLDITTPSGTTLLGAHVDLEERFAHLVNCRHIEAPSMEQPDRFPPVRFLVLSTWPLLPFLVQCAIPLVPHIYIQPPSPSHIVGCCG